MFEILLRDGQPARPPFQVADLCARIQLRPAALLQHCPSNHGLKSQNPAKFPLCRIVMVGQHFHDLASAEPCRILPSFGNQSGKVGNRIVQLAVSA